ncbi:hypothetical protein STEG23_002529 [Scotinomys teguina]
MAKMEKMWSKRNTPPLLVGIQIGTTTLEINILTKLGIILPQDTAIPLLGIYSKNAQSYHKDTCSTMFIAALFVIARIWKQPRCPSTEEWIRKMWFIYTMEYYTAEKNNDFMKFAGKWMELENVILSEVRTVDLIHGRYCENTPGIHVVCHILKVQFLPPDTSRNIQELCFRLTLTPSHSPWQDESGSYTSFSRKTIRLPRWLGLPSKETSVLKTKCELSKPCLDNFFAFKISSGAANVVGPSMCFENEIIMSPVRNNVGRGLNIALVNGTTGQVLRKDSFDMYSGEPNLLMNFLEEIPDSTLVLVASYDDPGTKMNDKIRMIFSNLGSSYANQLGFRDSWVFLGAKDLKNKSPFEQTL